MIIELAPQTLTDPFVALSYIDNTYGMAILAYDKKKKIRGMWERHGARYITDITLNVDKVEFVGQGGRSISLSLE